MNYEVQYFKDGRWFRSLGNQVRQTLLDAVSELENLTEQQIAARVQNLDTKAIWAQNDLAPPQEKVRNTEHMRPAYSRRCWPVDVAAMLRRGWQVIDRDQTLIGISPSLLADLRAFVDDERAVRYGSHTLDGRIETADESEIGLLAECDALLARIDAVLR